MQDVRSEWRKQSDLFFLGLTLNDAELFGAEELGRRALLFLPSSASREF